jgi:hypothetical protein
MFLSFGMAGAGAWTPPFGGRSDLGAHGRGGYMCLQRQLESDHLDVVPRCACMPPKRKKEPETRVVSGPLQARSTWPTGFLKRRESQEQLAKPGHYKTKAAFCMGGGKDEHVGPSSAMEDGEFGFRLQLLMFPNGTVRVMGALYAAEVEVDEETGEACGMTSVNDVLLNGHVGVSRYGRSVLTTLQDGFIAGGFEQGEGYEVPHKFRAELKVLQPGQTFRVEQCPHDAAQRAQYPARG